MSFVTLYIVVNFRFSTKILVEPFSVSIPMGKFIIARWIYRNCPVMVSQNVTSADLVKLEMADFDSILGMDWLHSYYDTIGRRNKIVQFQFPNKPVLEWRDSTSILRGHLVSYLRVRRMISKGCVYYLV